MPDHQLEAMRSVINDTGGLVIVSAPKDQGLTTTLYAVLRAHDAFLTHIQTIERDPEQDLEGITQNKLAPNASAQEEAKQVDWIISQEPDIIAVASVQSPESARDLAKAAAEKRVYI